MILRLFLSVLPCLLFASYLNADIVSVNFHVDDDADAPADHILIGAETAGVGSFNTSAWNLSLIHI